jgi:hypothetical protein
MICTDDENYSADQIKRDEGAELVEVMGVGRDCTFVVVETGGKQIYWKK